MSLYATSISINGLRPDKIVSSIGSRMEGTWKGDLSALIQENALGDPRYAEHNLSLGTIGGGNHFAELQQIVEIFNPQVVADLGLSSDSAVLMVHSGSRGLGQDVLKSHTDEFGAAALTPESPEAEEYLRKHNFACHWAQCNRSLIARRFFDATDSTGRQVLDISHNSVCVLDIMPLSF
jgi:release factor H-coupled RctB family protein